MVATLLIVSLAQLGVQSAPRGLHDPRPDFVITLADDLGFSDVGFTLAGDSPSAQWQPKAWRTPLIDAWAAKGTVLNRLYTHSWCAPSRAALITGRYQHSSFVQDSLGAHMVLQKPLGGEGLDEPTIPMALAAAGYRTGHIGKWHLSGNTRSNLCKQTLDTCVWGVLRNTTPTAIGFQSSFGFLEGDAFYWPGTRRAWFRDHKVIEQPLGYLTDVFGNAAAEFIGQAEVDHRPYFLYLAPNAPHWPWQAKQSDMSTPECARYQYEGPPTKKLGGASHLSWLNRTYCGMLVALDRLVGSVFNAITALPKERHENTLVLFTSDNGPDVGPWTYGSMFNGRWHESSLGGGRKGPGFALPLVGSKGTEFEGGLRAPSFAWWPAVLGSGRRSNVFMHLADIKPTMLEAAGVATHVRPWTGMSRLDEFKQELNGKAPVPPRTMLRNVISLVEDTRHEQNGGGTAQPGSMLGKWWRVVSGMWSKSESHPHTLSDPIIDIRKRDLVAVECARTDGHDPTLALHRDGWKWTTREAVCLRFLRPETLQHNKRLRSDFICEGVLAHIFKGRHPATPWLSKSEYHYFNDLRKENSSCKEKVTEARRPHLFNVLADPLEEVDLAARMPTLMRLMADAAAERCLAHVTKRVRERSKAI